MKGKRYLCLVLVLVAFLLAFPVGAAANAPAPTSQYHINLSGLPEGTVYVDLLIPMEKDDPHYLDLVSENLPEGFTPDSQIVTYHVDGFCSYTFHYRNAYSRIKVEPGKSVSFLGNRTAIAEFDFAHFEDVESRGEIRLAMLDQYGNILKVSGKCSVIPRNPFARSIGIFYYDAATDQWELRAYTQYLAVFLYIFISYIGLGLTCLVEWLVAWPFGCRSTYGRAIIWTNVISQIAMRLAHIFLYTFLLRNYAWTVLLLEVLVYTGEYLFYQKKMKDISWKRVLAYTVAANTASLVLGYLLNLWVLF